MQRCNSKMRRRSLWMVFVAIGAGLPLTACGARVRTSADGQTTPLPLFKVEAAEGTTLSRVILTPRMAERIDVRTAPVREEQVALASSAEPRKVVPYASVLYDTNNATWLYTSPEPLVFVRHPIAIDYIEGDRAVLSDGPAVGTAVVTAGAAELFGAEFEAAR